MNRRNEVFLETLAATIQPIRPRGLLRRYAFWTGFVALLVLGVGIRLTRPGLAERLGQVDFVLQFGLWLLVALVAGSCAFVLATPRWPLAKGLRPAMVAVGAGLLVFSVWLVMRMPVDTGVIVTAPEPVCAVIVSGTGLLTAFCMMLALKGKARPTYPWLMALMLAIAGVGAGMMAIMLACPHEEAQHVLFSHFLPGLGMGFCLTLLARRHWHW